MTYITQKKTMKTSKHIAILATALLLTSCQDFFSGRKGSLEVRIEPSSGPQSRSGSEPLPHTDDFILKIQDPDGRLIHNGRFGDSPERLELTPGNYTVSAYSCEFEAPAFAKPQYGDSQLVAVRSDERVCAELFCSQTNSGIRLEAEDSFKDSFPDADIYIRSSSGELLYSYEEQRIAYFPPGKLTVVMEENGNYHNLFSRTLKEQQILRIRLAASEAEDSGGISIQLDSSRNWLSENYIYGDDNSGEIWDAYDVSEARENAEKKDVWVYGYIVGVATGTGRIDFEAPFDKNTNLVLGLRSVTSDKEYCLSVELKSGAIREELNLCDNPELKGQLIYIKGDLVSAYYGIPGLKNVEEYQFGN